MNDTRIKKLIQFKILPVDSDSGFCFTQCGTIKPMSKDIPMTAKFLDEFKSIYWRFDKTRPRNVPNPTTDTPPMTGSGIVTNTAVNFPNTENTIKIIAKIW